MNFNFQAGLAPGKNRIARVKKWLHESLYGLPMDDASIAGGASQTSRNKIRKYRVRGVGVHWHTRQADAESREYCS